MAGFKQVKSLIIGPNIDIEEISNRGVLSFSLDSGEIKETSAKRCNLHWIFRGTLKYIIGLCGNYEVKA